jgi:hypothetical protein
MTRYTVVWHVDAQNQLAKLWMEAADRNAVTHAADAVDAVLVWDAPTKGIAVEGDLQELIHPPLQLLFGVSEPDRLVRIVNVELL